VAPLAAPLGGDAVKLAPRVAGDPLYGNGGFDFEQVEHIVTDEEPDTALCGIDQTDVPGTRVGPSARRASRSPRAV
jgi:hypothetical protein